jgi:hypothetical protein
MVYSLTGNITKPTPYVPPVVVVPPPTPTPTPTPTTITTKITPTYNDILTLSGRIYNLELFDFSLSGIFINYNYNDNYNQLNDLSNNIITNYNEQYLINNSLSGLIYTNYFNQNIINNEQYLINNSLSGLIYYNNYNQNIINNSFSDLIYTIENRDYLIGTTTSLSYGNQPTISITYDLSNNIVYNFGLVSGANGINGDKGDTGSKGDKGDRGNMGDNGLTGGSSGGGGSAILGIFISIIFSICTTLISDAILSAIGAATIASLQTEITSLTLQVALLSAKQTLLSAKQSLQDARIVELEAKTGINETLLERLEAKVSSFNTLGQYSSINTSLSVWSPFLPSEINGDLMVTKSLFIDGGVYVRDMLSPTGYKRLDTNLNNLI